MDVDGGRQEMSKSVLCRGQPLLGLKASPQNGATGVTGTGIEVDSSAASDPEGCVTGFDSTPLAKVS